MSAGYCPFCGGFGTLETHHIFCGRNRKASDRIGATIKVCHACHMGIHNGKMGKDDTLMNELRKDWQREYEKKCGRKDFMEEIGRSYL